VPARAGRKPAPLRARPGGPVPQRCNPVRSCAQFTGDAEVPGVVALRIGGDGSLRQAGMWTGGEVAALLPVRGVLAVVHHRGVALVDPRSLRTLGSAGFVFPR
jgi:hypothetical protein